MPATAITHQGHSHIPLVASGFRQGPTDVVRVLDGVVDKLAKRRLDGVVDVLGGAYKRELVSSPHHQLVGGMGVDGHRTERRSSSGCGVMSTVPAPSASTRETTAPPPPPPPPPPLPPPPPPPVVSRHDRLVHITTDMAKQDCTRCASVDVPDNNNTAAQLRAQRCAGRAAQTWHAREPGRNGKAPARGTQTPATQGCTGTVRWEGRGGSGAGVACPSV